MTSYKLAPNRQSLSTTLRTIRIAFVILIPLLLCCLVTPASAGIWAEYLPGSVPYTQVEAGSTQVWALDQNGNVYQYSSSTNSSTRSRAASFGLRSVSGTQFGGSAHPERSTNITSRKKLFKK
jgi:hypothetical protein